MKRHAVPDVEHQIANAAAVVEIAESVNSGIIRRVIVSTERLGWPGRESGLLERLGISQKRLVYPHDAATPTATCHLQRSPDENALCGYPWECLGVIPGEPGWTDLHPDLRCDECEDQAGVAREDPTDRTYRFTL